MKTIIPDTSAVIIGAVSEIIEKEDLDYPEIIIPEAVVCELEHQANANRREGIDGLNELQHLQHLQDEGKLAVSFKGKRPTNYDIRYAKSGEIDAIIRDLARSEFGTLLTNDKVQAETAKAQGIPVYYFEQKYVEKTLTIAKFFDDETMSVHLKENVCPMAKKGTPGHIKFVKLSDEIFNYGMLQEIIDEIIEKARSDSKTYLESVKEGSIVVQSREYRISIARPPFSEAIEITAVRPVADIDLDEYHLSSKLMDRINNTYLSDKMLDKHVIDNTHEEKKEIFNYPLGENQKSDDLVMITSDLVKDYDEGSDGYALFVEKRPSLTPLNVNMTYEDLKDWF